MGKTKRKKTTMTKTKGDAVQMLYMINTPIIVSPGYEDSVTEEQKSKHQLEALGNISEIFENKQSTDFSAMLYISNASLMGPLSEEQRHIYEFIFSQFYDFKALIGKDPPKELSETEALELKKLKEWIFKKQVEHLKSKV